MSKATNVTKQAKRAGKAWVDQSVRNVVACFAECIASDTAVQNAKALWDAARMGTRIELKAAQSHIESGKPWDAYKGKLRAALVAAKVCATTKAAGRMIDNQLIALGLTGKGTKKGGPRKGAGRKETTDTGTHETLSEKMVAARLVSILAYVVDQQAKPTDDADTILGRVAALANGVTD